MPGRSSLRPRTAAAIRRKKPWYDRDGGVRLAHDQTLVRDHYPGLRHRVDDYTGRVWLEGAMTLRTRSGIPKRFEVRVDFPYSYPGQEPRIYETAGRFPRHPDRHMLPDGQCCLWLAPESKWSPEDPDSLLSFLDEAIVFFERQLIHEMYPEDPWPGGEREHGSQGYAQYISDLLGGDKELISSLAPVLAGEFRVGRNDGCPCSSGNKYKRCCLPRVELVEQSVCRDVLRRAIQDRRGDA